MMPKIMPVSDLRRHTSEIFASIREQDNVIYITQHGRPAAVLLDYERYEAMVAQLEDLSDLAALAAAADDEELDYEEYLAERSRRE